VVWDAAESESEIAEDEEKKLRALRHTILNILLKM
jgi:hypothetical protein